MTKIKTVEVFDFTDNNGETFAVSIVKENWSAGKVVVQSWHGEATPTGWKSLAGWDGHRFVTTRDQLTNPRTLSLFADGPLEA